MKAAEIRGHQTMVRIEMAARERQRPEAIAARRQAEKAKQARRRQKIARRNNR